MWRKPGVALLIAILILFSTFGSTRADAPLIRGAVDIIFVIDASGSMNSIISKVKEHTAWFAQEVQRRGYNYRLGLVVFADTSGYYWPPRWYGFTTNVNTFIGWVNGLSTSGGSEPTTRALEVALQAFLNEGRSSAGRMIILVTDENIQTYGGPSVASIAKSLGQANVITNIIAYDSGNSATIHKETRGKFYNAGSSGSGVRPAYEDILNQIGLNRLPVISNVSYTPQNPFLNNNVTLIAYASDPDGDPLVYTWTARKPNGQSVTLGQGSSVTFKPDIAGSWSITVTVNDPFGAQDSRTITLTVGAFDLSAVLVPEQVTRGQRVRVYATLTAPAQPKAEQFFSYRTGPYDEMVVATDAKVTKGGNWGLAPQEGLNQGVVWFSKTGFAEYRFTKPSTAVYAQFVLSDHNDGHVKIYVDGIHYGTFQTLNAGNNYVRVGNLPNTVHTIRIELVGDGDLHLGFFGAAVEPVEGNRVTADSISVVLPNGQQLGMNWDATLGRYWADFTVPERSWANDGTHTLRVVAVKYGVEKSVTLSFVVRGNIKEKLYIRQIIF